MHLAVLIGFTQFFEAMKAYYRIYYCLVSFLLKGAGFRDDRTGAARYAVLIISWVDLNFLFFLKTLSLCLEIKGLLPSSVVYIAGGVLLLIVNSLLFLRKKRYHAICEMFQKESRKERIIRNVVCVAFMIFALLSPALTGLFFDNPYMK